MLRKIKKALPAVVSAILCVTMTFGITASADLIWRLPISTKTTESATASSTSVWKNAKALTSAKYNSSYIKWVEKYSAKSSKNTVTFSKSRTKKFLDKQIKATKSDDPQICVSLTTKDVLVSLAYKGDSMKMVLAEGDMGFALYMNPKKITMLSVPDKKKTTVNVTAEMEYDEMIDEMKQSFMDFDSDDYYANLGIAENAKGKLFKIASGDKIYYYEEFKSADYDKFGFLFTEKGTPVAMIGDDVIACFTISNNVKDSEFTVPKGYTETDISDLGIDLDSLL